MDACESDKGKQNGCRAIAGFRRCHSGATAVEFALVAIPFFALLFAVLQTALIFFASQVLDTGVSEAARLIRTGQVKAQGYDQDKLKQIICKQIGGLIKCKNNLRLDVRTYPAFDKIDMTKNRSDYNSVVKNPSFQPGNGGDIVVVRAYAEWPVIAPIVGPSLGNLDNGNHLLASASVFRNEPFP